MITYRNAGTDNISDIINIELSSFNGFITESEETFLERISTFPEGFRLLKLDGEIAGYISSEIWFRIETLEITNFTLDHSIRQTHKPNGNELYISSMGVLPEKRGRGVGYKLFTDFIEYVKTDLPQIKSVILVVSEKWYPARKIYACNGFKEIAILNGFFAYDPKSSTAENGIVMRLELDTTVHYEG